MSSSLDLSLQFPYSNIHNQGGIVVIITVFYSNPTLDKLQYLVMILLKVLLKEVLIKEVLLKEVKNAFSSCVTYLHWLHKRSYMHQSPPIRVRGVWKDDW